MKNLIKLCVFSILFFSSLLSGCASSRNLIVNNETAAANNNEYARIHLFRETGIGGAAANFIVIDVGEIYGDTGNIATIAREDPAWFDIHYMSGDLMNLKTGVVTKGIWKGIGKKEDLCGYDVSEIVPPHAFKGIMLKDVMPKFKTTCPKLNGRYITIEGDSIQTKDLEISKPILDKVMDWLVGKIFNTSEIRGIVYNYQKFTAIGEISNNDELIWQRPAGKLSLQLIGCIGACAGWIGRIGYGIEYQVNAGQDYYLYMDQLYVIKDVQLSPRE